MKSTCLGLVLVTVILLACAPAPRVPRIMPSAPITATAPKGINDDFLGAPVDVHFRPLQGEIGRTLFPAARIFRQQQSYVAHDVITVRDESSLDANMAAWSLFDASLKVDSDARFGTYRAFQVVGTSVIDDTVDINDPPPEAAFYVSKVLWGYSYEAVFEGNRHDFSAGVGAHFVTVQGDIGTFAANHRLKLHFTGVGLRPRSPQSLFAHGQQEIMAAYDTDGPPSPIFVEYRPLPGRALPPNAAIPFETTLDVAVEFIDLRILEDGSAGTTPWSISARCAVRGTSEGPSLVELLPPNTRVDEGGIYTLNQTIDLVATQGDWVECTSDGTFSDTFTHGTVAPGRSPPVLVTGPTIGPIPISIVGSGETAYTVDARIEVRK